MFFKNSQKIKPTKKEKAFIYSNKNVVWSDRNYEIFAREGFAKNVIANRCVNLIAKSAASIPFILYKMIDGKKVLIPQHPLLDTLSQPNPFMDGAEFMESLYNYLLIAGNCYINVAMSDTYSDSVFELYSLRPDRVSILTDNNNHPSSYIYKTNKQKRIFKINNVKGLSDILHIRNFNPLNDFYGLSQMEAASYAIDQHNEASKWNQSLLQNGARPSGALVLKDGERLSDEEFERLRNQFGEEYSGASNAGKPILLEGGLDWREMSLNPKDMDFLNVKHSSAREIALAFGVPPQLLCIPGDNTYSNMAEARLAFWEQTIIPLIENVVSSMSDWLSKILNEKLVLTYDKNNISALQIRRMDLWENVIKADFLTIHEKREMLGFGYDSNITTNNE